MVDIELSKPIVRCKGFAQHLFKSIKEVQDHART